MKCPNCDYDFPTGNVCPNCKIDSILYTKTVKVSDMLYNSGLNKARVQDLSGAVECLHKSIEFNKNNVTARNLLGLCFYESGLVGDALKQWIISVSLLKEKNPAQVYIDNLQNNNRILEKYNDAIKMYNQALMYIKQKSDDMAIIQLKKALEINPRFSNALNLLTFCYLIQRDREKAVGCVEKVLTIDVNNSIALNYYNEIYPTKTRPEPSQRVKRAPQPVTSVQPPSYTRLSPRDEKRLGSNFHFAEILSFIIGGLCGLAIVYALLVPSTISAKDKIINELSVSSAATEQSLRDEIEQKNSEIETLKGEKTELEQSNQTLNEQVVLSEKIQKIATATSLYNENKIEEAADVFSALELTGLPRDVLENAETTKEASLKAAASSLYNQGLRDYNSGDNEKANASFEKALKYANPEHERMDFILYYLGLIAEESDDTVSAKRYYERVINEYPNSSQVTKATNRLNGLT